MTTSSPYGRVADGYRIVGRIRRGPDATVYHATRESDDTAVALKVLRTDAHLDGELSHLRRLPQHPHVVRVFETGRTPDGRPFMAMEYHPDGSYADLLSRSGPVSVDEAVQVGIAIAEALQATHDVDLVHRDVTPGNILRGAHGPMLTDFGIAAVPGELAGTVALDRLTPPHASPEALLRQSQDARSDVYSLASTIWTLIAGYPPYASPDNPSPDPFEYRERALNQPVPPVPDAKVPVWLQANLRQAMAKAPDARHPSAAAFATALRERRDPAPAPIHGPKAPSTDEACATNEAEAPVAPSAPAVSPPIAAATAELSTFPATAKPRSEVAPTGDEAAAVAPSSPAPVAGTPVTVTQVAAIAVPAPAILAPPVSAPPVSALPVEPQPGSAPTKTEPAQVSAPPAQPPTYAPPAGGRASAPPAYPPPAGPTSAPPARPPAAGTPFTERPLAPPAGGAQPLVAPAGVAQPAVPPVPMSPAAAPPTYRPPAAEPAQHNDADGQWWLADARLPTPAEPDDDGDNFYPIRPAPRPRSGKGLLIATAVVALVVVGAAAFLLLPKVLAAQGQTTAQATPTALPTASEAAGIAPQDVQLKDETVAATLTWKDPTNGEAVFYVVDTPAGGAPSTVARAERGATSVRVIGLNPTVDHCFVVGAALSVDQVGNAPEVCTQRFGSAPPKPSASLVRR